MPLGPDRGSVHSTMMTEPHLHPSCHEEAVADDLDGNVSSRNFPPHASPAPWGPGLGIPGLPPAGMGCWVSPPWGRERLPALGQG